MYLSSPAAPADSDILRNCSQFLPGSEDALALKSQTFPVWKIHVCSSMQEKSKKKVKE